MNQGRAAVIEPDRESRESITRILEELGFSLDIQGESLNDRIRDWSRARPDLYVLDFETPGVDGIKLLEALHDAQPDAVVIALASKTQRALGDLAVRKGATAFLTKPLDSKELRVAVEIAQQQTRRIALHTPRPARPLAMIQDLRKIEGISVFLLLMFSVFYMLNLPVLGQPAFLLLGPGIGFFLALRSHHRR